MHPFLDQLRPTLHISHRGGAGIAPENTELAFWQAIARYRTDAIELDLQCTSDGVLVVAHDPTLDRCTDGQGLLASLRFSELQRVDAGHRFTRDGGKTFPFRGQGLRIPAFESVLAAFPDIHMNVDVKPDAGRAVDTLAALLCRRDTLARLWIGSEDDAISARLVAVLPQAVHFMPREALARWVTAVGEGTHTPDPGPYAMLDTPARVGDAWVVTPELLSAAKRAGLWVNAWTVDTPEHMQQLCAWGVGGIMTDRPDLLREVLSVPA